MSSDKLTKEGRDAIAAFDGEIKRAPCREAKPAPPAEIPRMGPRAAARPSPRVAPRSRPRWAYGRPCAGPSAPNARRWTPTASQISAARRDYLDFWGHLLTLRVALLAAGLGRIKIGSAMPPVVPWRTGH